MWPQENAFVWTEGILLNHIKIKDLDISNDYWYTRVIRPQGKSMLIGLKQCQNHFKNQTFKKKPSINILITTPSINKSYDLRKVYFMWTKEISKDHFHTKDLYVNNHSKYTQLMWSQGKQNLHGLKE